MISRDSVIVEDCILGHDAKISAGTVIGLVAIKVVVVMKLLSTCNRTMVGTNPANLIES